MICASAELSALDQKLADDYEATLHQANIDGKKLQSEEAQWLRDVRNRCTTAECVESSYQARDGAILEMSLRAASPAAYEDTRPFQAPLQAFSAARMLVNETCDGAPAKPLPGTKFINHFHLIVSRGGYAVPLTVDGYPFAFWLGVSDSTPSRCTIRDVVALPPPAAGNRFLQCYLGDDSHGFAVRSSKGTTVAYWSITADGADLRREPIHVIGEQNLHCQEPETAD